MIERCNNSMQNEIFDYIGSDYGKCLYVFIDLKKYGTDEEFFKVWMQKSNEEMTAIITEYYGGYQIYSRDLNLDVEEVAGFLKEQGAELIFGIQDVIDKIQPHFEGFGTELGVVGELKDIKVPVYEEAYSAGLDEMKEIAELVAADPAIGAPYGFDSLYEQYVERKTNNYGRNYILRDEETGEIICHAGTYAEVPELSVIGGVISNPKYRGKGYSKGTLAALCDELKREGKDVFSFFYIPSATAMHYGVGFEKIGIWAKLFKKEN